MEHFFQLPCLITGGYLEFVSMYVYDCVCVCIYRQTYIYIYLNLPLVHKNVYHFFPARFQKMCSFRGLKKRVSEVLWLSIVISTILSPKAGKDTCSRANACAACQIPPRTATTDNMGCIAAHVNNRALDRVNLKYPLQHHVCFSYLKLPQATSSYLKLPQAHSLHP